MSTKVSNGDAKLAKNIIQHKDPVINARIVMAKPTVTNDEQFDGIRLKTLGDHLGFSVNRVRGICMAAKVRYVQVNDIHNQVHNAVTKEDAGKLIDYIFHNMSRLGLSKQARQKILDVMGISPAQTMEVI